jgi:hypothetical protein
MPTRSQRGGRPRVSVVPAQFLGYSLQEFRVLQHLLLARGDSWVCLEFLGDTATIAPDGRIRVEEAKSRQSRANPLSDNAVDLWKTLANWSRSAAGGEFDPSITEFAIYVSRRFGFGAIVDSFVAARTRPEARKAIASARESLGSSRGTLIEHLEAFFGSPPDVQAAIVQGFSVCLGSGNAYADLLQTARDAEKWASDHKLEDVLLHLLGWVKREVTALIQANKPAVVSSRAMNHEARNFVRRLDREDILLSRAPDPTDEVRDGQKSRTYVRQLDLIGLKWEDKVRAINSFLKAEVDRHQWGISGDVFPSSFNEYEEDLVAMWEAKRLHSAVSLRDRAEEDLGKVVYSLCCEYRPRLRGAETPPYFCSGSYHLLADRHAVGWHPRFLELLPSRE